MAFRDHCRRLALMGYRRGCNLPPPWRVMLARAWLRERGLHPPNADPVDLRPALHHPKFQQDCDEWLARGGAPPADAGRRRWPHLP